MTQALFLVTRASGDEGAVLIDGVFAVVANEVSTANSATVIAAAVAQCNANKGSLLGAAPYPDDYFDTVTTLSDLSAGPLATNGSAAVFGGIGTDANVTIVA